MSAIGQSNGGTCEPRTMTDAELIASYGRRAELAILVRDGRELDLEDAFEIVDEAIDAVSFGRRSPEGAAYHMGVLHVNRAAEHLLQIVDGAE